MITEDSINFTFEKELTSLQIMHFLNSPLYFGELSIKITNKSGFGNQREMEFNFTANFKYFGFNLTLLFQILYMDSFKAMFTSELGMLECLNA